jgi:hypothetical protein
MDRKESSITVAEELILKKYLPASVTVGTANGYAGGFKKWTDYIDSLPQDVCNSRFLEDVGDDGQRAKRVVLFMADLYEKGFRDEQISRAVTCVSFQFGVEGVPSDFFKQAIIARARKAGVRSTDEARELEESRTSKVKLPLCIEMVWSVRETLWVESDWSAQGMDLKAIWLVICLGFDSGPRIGNLTLKDGKDKEDHCVRAGHLAFTIVEPVTGLESGIKGGPLVTEFLKRKDVQRSMVLWVDIVYVTHKTANKVKTTIKHPKKLARETEKESQVFDDLLSWFIYSGVQEKDELLTRVDPASGRRKVVIRKDVNAVIKTTAQRFGLPAENFSCKSLRSGFGTHAKANGMSEVDMNERGGWAAGSTVLGRHYARDMHSKGAFALSVSATGVQNHGLSEIRRMLPACSSLPGK